MEHPYGKWTLNFFSLELKFALQNSITLAIERVLAIPFGSN